MGFLGWIRSTFGGSESIDDKLAQMVNSQKPAAHPGPSNLRTASQPAARRRGPLRGSARWHGIGESVQVGNLTFLGGMVYVGQNLVSPRGGIEPSLIDPSLRVDTQNPDWLGQSLDYWPSYASITPAARAAYLTWLASGRRHPDVPIGYVFLFMYGLERRVLVEITADPSLTHELVQVRAEMSELLNLYGDTSGSFSSYASRFVETIDFMLLQAPKAVTENPPVLTNSRWVIPTSLRVGLGDLVADGKPIPPDWALAWAWFHPDISLRTPAKRCPEEFTRLFKIRYFQKYSDGFTVRPGKPGITLEYYSASSQIGPVNLMMENIPDVFHHQVPYKKLSALVDEVTAELEAYSRWLGRNPDSAGTLAAAALLPADLIEGRGGAAQGFRQWVVESLGAAETAVLSGSDIFQHWPAGPTRKLGKTETISLVTLLGTFGAGLEPDVRFGGSPITAETPAVLFRLKAGSPHAPTAAYSTALTLVHLAAAVTAADGHVMPAELDHLTSHLESSLQLTSFERTRLHAHLQWLGETEVKLTGLTKRLSSLTNVQRTTIAEVLVTVAAADGHISPDEVIILQKIHKLLGLDTSTVPSQLHAALTGSPTIGPVTVRPAGPKEAGYAIPPRPVPMTDAKPTEATPANSGFTLDPALIQAKMAETAAISVLLDNIFDDEPKTTHPQTVETPKPPGVQLEQTVSIRGLDSAHSALVHVLAERGQLSRNEFEDLAEHHGLLPDGALDALNEAALDASDEPLIEGDETLTINVYALQELLS